MRNMKYCFVLAVLTCFTFFTARYSPGRSDFPSIWYNPGRPDFRSVRHGSAGTVRYGLVSTPAGIPSFRFEQRYDELFDLEPSTPTIPDDQKPPVSGPIDILPWEDDESFLSAQDENHTPVLMAAYRTVLKDPLPGEEYNVHLAARMLAGTVVKPGQVFSQNALAGPYTQDRGYQKGPTYIGSRLTTTIGGGVCKIASTLYNVTILSNLKIVERHSHSMPVPYVPYGQDATVAYGAKDFKFRNNLDFPILVWAQGIENVLYIAFYGAVEPPDVEWHHEVLKAIEAPYIYQTNPELKGGEERIVLEGMDGAIVRSWLSIKEYDGTVTVKPLGNSNYLPMPHIVERGISSPSV